MKSVTLVFPHQLFEENPAVSSDIEVFLVEEFLFFKQYNFHRQKLKYHRATMKFYEDFLRKKKLKTHYIEANNELADVRRLIPWLIKQGYDEIRLCEVVDNWLEKRIKKYGSEIKITEYQTPMFLNSKEELKAYFYSKKRYFQTDFYIEQRKKRR
ncbi:MAG: cryptochrome/photolyase family protein, partial [Pyrinomonadaceae bacterium]|nr:cryptochrome/photolyase family protein [Pyrinomonadaceae bacterium]